MCHYLIDKCVGGIDLGVLLSVVADGKLIPFEVVAGAVCRQTYTVDFLVRSEIGDYVNRACWGPIGDFRGFSAVSLLYLSLYPFCRNPFRVFKGK